MSTAIDRELENPTNLNNLIDYQAQSVVSRALLKKRTGTVTLFAFDAGQALSEHSAPFDALVQVIDGEAEIEISGTLHTVKSGEALLLPANIPHAVHARTRFQMVLTMIRS
ncbi:MAG: cupin domain-containing protein [bacterium]